MTSPSATVKPRPLASPNEVIDALAEQHKPQFDGDDRRTRLRYNWHVVLTIQVEDPSRRTTGPRQIEVTTQDISVGGFAFTHNQYVHPESILHARFEALPGKPELTAIVRSCVPLAGSQVRVGAQFVEKWGEG